MVGLAIFIVPLLLSAAVAPLAIRLSQRFDLVAVPGGRRQHKGRIPVLGGVPLAVGYLAGIGLIWWQLPPTPDRAPLLVAVILGTLFVIVTGLWDDARDLPFGFQLVLQFVVVIVAVSFELFFERFTNPFTGGEVPFHIVITIIVTYFWIAGTMNAVNWLDGVDGLATGVGAIAALIFAAHGYTQLDQTTVAAFPLALAGALIGFLPFNFAPAKLYLGTAGVWLLGYNLATLAIIAPAKMATALLVLALPLLDGVWRIIDRTRRGNSPFKGDRGHLHFILTDRGWSPQRITLSYYSVALIFGLVALYAPTPLSKLIVLLALGVAVLAVLIHLTRADHMPAVSPTAEDTLP